MKIRLPCPLAISPIRLSIAVLLIAAAFLSIPWTAEAQISIVGTPTYADCTAGTGCSNNNPLVIAAPTGVASGDVEIAFIAYFHIHSPTPPSGWSTSFVGSQTGTSNGEGDLWCHDVTGSETNWSWSFSGTSFPAGGIIALRGAGTCSSLNDGQDRNYLNNGTTSQVNGLTAHSGDFLLGFTMTQVSTGYLTTMQTGLTTAFNTGAVTSQTFAAAAGYVGPLSAGATGNFTGALSPSQDWGTFSILIKAPVVATPTPTSTATSTPTTTATPTATATTTATSTATATPTPTATATATATATNTATPTATSTPKPDWLSSQQGPVPLCQPFVITGKPASGAEYSIAAPLDLTFPANLDLTVGGFATGCIFKTAATADATFVLQDNGTTMATLTVLAGSTTCTRSSQAPFTISRGHRVAIVAPTQDATLADGGITVCFTRRY
jgi:hypothetical protein